MRNKRRIITLLLILFFLVLFATPIVFANSSPLQKHETQTLCNYPVVIAHNDYKIYYFGAYTLYKDDFSSVVYKDDGAYYIDYVFPDHTQYYDNGVEKANIYNRYDYSVMVSPGTRILWANIGYPSVYMTPGSSRGVASGTVRLSTPFGYTLTVVETVINF